MMKSIKINKEACASLFILISAFLVSSAIVARAQTATSDASQTVSVTATTTTSTAAQGIAFPIPELGNCSSKEDCKNYCDQTANMDVCIAYAKAHGLMNSDEASRADNFRKVLQTGGGPGGCTTPQECNSFCSDIKNLDACISFAKAHNLKVDNEEINQAQKIYDYIKNGGQTPGGCTTKDACETYCSDFSHAQECYTFAQKVGLTQVSGQGVQGGIPSGQFQKFLELVKNGQTPGGCTTKDACETYCEDSAHASECLKFGQEIGVISQDQADKIQQLGGKGPGGCTSQESCSAYCNDPAHRDECFKFAQDNGLIPKDQIDSMKNGLTQMMMGISQMPPEVAACIKSSLGISSVEDIQSSQLMPGTDMGNKIHDCFDKFGQKADPAKAFQNMPSGVQSCLKQKLGDSFSNIASGQQQPSASDAEAFRVCSEQNRLENVSSSESEGDGARISDFLRSAPPTVGQCISNKLGGQANAIASGQQQPSSDNIEKIKECFSEFRGGQQEGQQQMMPQASGTQMMPQFQRQGNGENRTQGGTMQKLDLGNLPPAVADCVKSASGGSDVSGFDLRDALGKCLQQIQGQQPNQSVPPAPGAGNAGIVPPFPQQNPQGAPMMTNPGTPIPQVSPVPQTAPAQPTD